MKADAIVVLGCRVFPSGDLTPVAEGRVDAAARAFHAGLAPVVVAAGGRAWGRQVEALAFRDALVRRGVPFSAIAVELWSFTTYENAVFSAAILESIGAASALVVTSAWHMRRALQSFRAAGIVAHACPSSSDPAAISRRAMERVRAWFDAIAIRRTRVLASSARSFCRRAPTLAAILACASVIAACGSPSDPGTSASSSTADPAPTSSATPAADLGVILDEILIAEHRRLVTDVRQEHLQSRDRTVRLAAVRALARIGGDASLPGLSRAVSDEDPEIVAWAAYGLGFSCKGKAAEHVNMLTARAVSLTAPSANVTDDVTRALVAIGRAIGACAADTSEPTLLAWLGGARPLALAGSMGLGDYVAAKQKLREETIVALLGRAAGSAAEAPMPEALFALARLEKPPPSTQARTREVAEQTLKTPGPARIFAMRALAFAGPDSVAVLARVFSTPNEFSAAERGEAARALGRLSGVGPRALADAVPAFLPTADPVSLTSLVSEDFGPLWAALEVLANAGVEGKAAKALADFAARAAPPEPPAAIARRLSWLRCFAAQAVVGKRNKDPLLAKCEVAAAPSATAAPSKMPPASIAARATVAVIGRAEIKGARLAAWRAFAEGPDVRAREAALELIAEHDEIDGAAAVLARALESKIPGAVSSAAEVIAGHPERASEDAKKKKKKKNKRHGYDEKDDKGAEKDEEPVVLGPPSPAVTKALLALIGDEKAAPDPEQDDTVLDAVGAIGLQEALSRVKALCGSPYPTTREHAAKALQSLTGKKEACNAPPSGGPPPPEMPHLVRAKTRIAFETDVGKLTMTLDPGLAPIAVTRIVDLVRAGYYNGMVVHRVVPGFVTQLGAPFGDGYGGPPDLLPLRCETSLAPYTRNAIGMALSGRDTGSSQIFVMHAFFPHLEGKYAVLGTADGPWAAFTDGDIVLSATVEGGDAKGGDPRSDPAAPSSTAAAPAP